MITSIPPSSYEIDLSKQADTLERAAAQPLSASLAALDISEYDRIILTGMGSSDSVSIPFELALLRLGLPVWRLQTSRLLETTGNDPSDAHCCGSHLNRDAAVR